MTPSGWNPPPGYRKLHGDLLYLQVLYWTVLYPVMYCSELRNVLY